MGFTAQAQKLSKYNDEEGKTPENMIAIAEQLVEKLKDARQAAKDKPSRENKQKVEDLERLIRREGIKLTKQGQLDPRRLHKRKVIYHSQKEQHKTKVIIQGGELVYFNDPEIKLDTTKMASHVEGIGVGIFTINAESNSVHVGTHQVGINHHSTLVGGALAAGAGDIKVEAGKVTFLSNKSGHYWPTHEHLLEMLHWLRKRQMPMNFRMKVYSVRKADPEEYDSADAYEKDVLNDERLGIVDYELNKLLAYAEHLTAEVLGMHPDGWRWQKPVDGKNAGVYDRNGNMVLHKTVRKWLKAPERKKYLTKIIHNLDINEEELDDKDKKTYERMKALKALRQELLKEDDDLDDDSDEDISEEEAQKRLDKFGIKASTGYGAAET